MSSDGNVIRRTERYEINGTVYHRLDDVPEPYRSMLADRNRDGTPDIFDGMAANNSAVKVVRTETKLSTSPTLRRYASLMGLTSDLKGFADAIGSDSRRLRGGRLHCVQCGYDLAAATVSGNCPECGLPVAQTIDHIAGGRMLDSSFLTQPTVGFRLYGSRPVQALILIVGVVLLLLILAFLM